MSGALTLGSMAEGIASGMQFGQTLRDNKRAMDQQDRMMDIMEKQAGSSEGRGMGATPAGATAASMPSSINADYVRAGLVKRGMAQHHADGFALNFGDESSFNTGAVGDNGAAYGLAQWNGPRRDALNAFASERGLEVGNADTQMDFLMHELNGSESKAWKAIQDTKTPGAAAAAIVNRFERPAEEHRARREASYLAYDSRPVMGAARPAY